MEIHKATQLASLLSDNDRDAVNAARTEVIERFAQRLSAHQRALYLRMVQRRALPCGLDFDGQVPKLPPVDGNKGWMDEVATFEFDALQQLRFHKECVPVSDEVSGDLYARSGGKLEDRGQRWTPKKRRG